MIIISGLTKTYKSKTTQEDVVALDDLTLFLPDKGFIAIYGASGCGKSTLLNVLGGLDLADSGKMIVNGRNTSKFTRKDWDSYRNQEVGFIFQNYYLLPHLNVFDNIAITLEMSKQTKGIKEKVKNALKQVDMDHYEKRYPKQLSGGQQQRVAIARALVSNPSIILADEPTGALDEKSSKSVMKNLKEISKEHLVVMVTHNERMAREYADRMIEISYGKIVQDDLIQPETDDIENMTPMFKVHLPFITSLDWSFRNVMKKKGRSIPIAIASAIGLAAAGIVLSMTSGVNNYVAEAQKAAIKDYPVYVSCYAKQSSESNKETMEEFPNTSDIIIEKSDYYKQEHYISMEDDFMKYINDMPKGNYAHYQTNVSLNYNLLTESKDPQMDKYIKVSSTTYTTCVAPTANDYKFINEQYDVLEGHLPQNDTDLTLVVDTYNRIDLKKLQNMGFDTSGDKIKAEDILNKKEYKVFSNDDMYTLEENVPIKKGDGTTTTVNRYEKIDSADYESLYLDDSKAALTLKVTGIIRPKADTDNQLYGNVLLYSPNLISRLTELNNESKIVKAQREYGITKDVLTGLPFEDVLQNSYNLSAQYQFESRLVDIGGSKRITAFYFYTETFEQRNAIIKYVEKYNEGVKEKDSNIVIRTRDYLEQVTSSFSSIAKSFSSVLFIFSLVSILVSAILTAILTYISVVERKREIGLLRSLGARRRDISIMFISEAAIIGIAAGILGIGLCYALSPLCAKIVVNLIGMYGSNILTPTVKTLSHIQPWLVPVMLIAAVILGVLSSFIPASIAGKKKPAESLRE